jgi:hypothetical protein
MSSLLISLPQDFVIFLWVSISRDNLPHPDGNRFMGKTLQRFQRSGSKVQRLNLKVSFRCRRVSSHLWPSIKPCQALHVDRQQWQSIARFFAEQNLICSSLISQTFVSCCAFRSAYSDEQHSRCPDQKLNLTTGDGFFACYFFKPKSRAETNSLQQMSWHRSRRIVK